MPLKTDYKDDIINVSANTNRVFNIVDDQGNVIYSGVSLVETTDFVQEGDSLGASDVNDITININTNSEAISELDATKQDKLTGSNFVGNIDSLYGQNKVYWINISNLPSGNTGALPFSEGYFHLICLSESAVNSSQIAIPYYNTEGNTVSYGQLYYRQYTNNKWYSWRRVYDSTDTSSAITAAISALDVSSVGGSGKYISAISETDGKISATASNLSTSPTSGSSAPITSGAVYSALDGLDASSVGGSGKYISAISQSNGKISATATNLITSISAATTAPYPPTAPAVVSYVKNAMSGLGTEVTDSQSSETNVANATTKKLYSKKLDIGTWSITCIVQFAENSSGYRSMSINTNSTNTSTALAVMYAACPNTVTRIEHTARVFSDGTSPVNVWVRQNSGATLGTKVVSFSAVKVKELSIDSASAG